MQLHRVIHAVRSVLLVLGHWLLPSHNLHLHGSWDEELWVLVHFDRVELLSTNQVVLKYDALGVWLIVSRLRLGSVGDASLAGCDNCLGGVGTSLGFGVVM